MIKMDECFMGRITRSPSPDRMALDQGPALPTGTTHGGQLPDNNPLKRRRSEAGDMAPRRPAPTDHLPQGAAQSTAQPSIRNMQPEAARAAATQMLQNLWPPKMVTNTPEEQRWNERLLDSRMMLNSITKHARKSDSAVGCYFEGQPVGLALISVSGELEAHDDLDHSKGVVVDYIVSHPGTTGVGGALIEHMVNTSAESGLGGRVQLSQVSTSGKAAYLALGFIEEGGLKMTLTPSAGHNAERWTQQDGQWRLKKYVAKPLPTSS